MTDFGEKSGYVGVMKGVIYSIAPSVLTVDLSHLITPQQIREGAFVLNNCYRYFPAETVHLAVVDPGVGTARRAICLRVPGAGYFVGPDNGLFSYIIAEHAGFEAREITNPAFMRPEISRTFHGRDVFAPTAAHLVEGSAFEEIGPLLETNSLDTLEGLNPLWQSLPGGSSQLIGHVVHVDHFGNLITDLPESLFEKLSPAQMQNVLVEVGSFYTLKGIRRTYGEAEPGQVISLFGSRGYLEAARVNGRADVLDGRPGPSLNEKVLVTVK
ncbi:MAG TPA: SAM-dependent chlorinase/fluorinase [Chloroflexia bacterium]|nr:SAM-dependent chlorinase/fluorinase [Chloroflexia bacterium]